MTVTVADRLIAKCVDLDVSSFFGLTGGGIMYLIDAIAKNPQADFVAFHHEGSAALAADAYARQGAKFGVVLATTGPGVANVFTAVAAAWQDSVPLVVVAGQVKTSDSMRLQSLGVRQNGTFEFDAFGSFGEVTKARYLLSDPEKVDYVFDSAIESATSERPGPVLIEVPLDIQGAPAPEPVTMPVNSRVSAGVVPQSQSFLVEEICNLVEANLSASSRPLFIFGAGLARARLGPEIFDVLAQAGLPYIVTQFGRQLGRRKDALYLGSPGIKANRSANLAISESDLLILMGTSLHQQVVGWNKDAFRSFPSRKIWLEIDPSNISAREDMVDIAINVSAELGSKSLVAAVKSWRENSEKLEISKWRKRCLSLKESYLWHFPEQQTSPGVLCLYRAMKELTERAENAKSLTTDAGVVWYAVAQHYFPAEGTSVISSGSFGAMGMALPYAIGAAVRNGGPVIAVTGDGSLMTCLQDLATMKELDLPILLIVNSNDGYLSIRTTHDKFFDGRKIGTDGSNGVFIPSLDLIASAFGIRLERPNSIEDFGMLLQKYLSDRGSQPVIIELVTPRDQKIEPFVHSRLSSAGLLESGSLADMFPNVPD